MICPRCKGKEFEETDDVRKPLEYLGKHNYNTVNYRYVLCNTCGARFVTAERFERYVHTAYQKDLFEKSKKSS